MNPMTSRTSFLAAAGAAVLPTGVMTGGPSIQPPRGDVKILILPANSIQQIEVIEWHLGPGGFMLTGFSVAADGPWVMLVKLLP